MVWSLVKSYVIFKNFPITPRVAALNPDACPIHSLRPRPELRSIIWPVPVIDGELKRRLNSQWFSIREPGPERSTEFVLNQFKHHGGKQTVFNPLHYFEAALFLANKYKMEKILSDIALAIQRKGLLEDLSFRGYRFRVAPAYMFYPELEKRLGFEPFVWIARLTNSPSGYLYVIEIEYDFDAFLAPCKREPFEKGVDPKHRKPENMRIKICF